MDNQKTNLENRESNFTKEDSVKQSENEESNEIYAYAHDNTKLLGFLMALNIVLTLAFICSLIISLGILNYSQDYFLLGVISGICSLMVIAINIFLICRIHMYMNFCKRYDLYMESLADKEKIEITELEDNNKITKDSVVKDLRLAVKRKLIPQGHFVEGTDMFILSDEMYKKYKEDLKSYN